MLNDIRLSSAQWAVLEGTAADLGAEMIRSYRGRFRPAGKFSAALSADRAGRLAQFVLAVSAVDPDLAAALASRAWEDELGRRKIFYFPGVHAPPLVTIEDLAAEGRSYKPDLEERYG